MQKFIFLGVLIVMGSGVLAQEGSALSAIKLLPKGHQENLALIEAREGAPVPERWYLLVHDKAAEAGFREFVIAGGAVVANRELSQFAESLSAEDVIGPESIKVDSSQAAALLRSYADANQLSFSAVNYQLKKENAVALWQVTALNAENRPIGSLMITAHKGTVLAHEGFELEPKAAQPAQPAQPVATPRPTTRRATLVATPTPKPNLIKRVGGGFQKIFGR